MVHETLINVTQEDIDNGEPLNSLHCPIARALYRTFSPSDYYFRVGFGNVRIYSPITDDNVLVRLPDECRKFIQAFDLRQPTSPFSFQFSHPFLHPH